MKTADLIADLARNVEPVAPRPVARRLALPTAIGVALAAALVIAWLGMRPMDEAIATSAFWMKAAYTSALLFAGALMLGRVARPGATMGSGVWLALLVVAIMALLATWEFMQTPPDDRMATWLGASWSRCPFRVAAVSAPVFIGLLVGLRRLAPTRLTLAGATAGFVAGALGATLYQLYCPETGAMFVATWYTLGVLACAVAGALIGRWALRW